MCENTWPKFEVCTTFIHKINQRRRERREGEREKKKQRWGKNDERKRKKQAENERMKKNEGKRWEKKFTLIIFCCYADTFIS